MRRYLVFFVLILALLMSYSSSSSASVAFSVMIPDLHTSLVVAGWVLTIYQLVSTVIMALAGKINEVIGRKPAFILYTAFFTVGSILSAVSPNIIFLIVARAIQGVGAGGFVPCAMEIVSDQFPEQRQKYISFNASVVATGMIIGPNLGGWLVQDFGWRSIFWVTVPVGVVILALSRPLIPSGGKKSGTSIDVVGASLLFGFVSAFTLSLTELGRSTGLGSLYIIGLFALSVILFLLFWRRERRTKEPIIDLELLTKQPFLAANIYNIIYGISVLGTFTLIPLYAVDIYKMTVLQSGVVLTPRSIGTILASITIGFFILRWGYRKPLLIGTLAIAASLVLLAFQFHGLHIGGVGIGDFTLLFAILGLWGIGHGICAPAANNACIELLPEKVATISGIRQMFRNLGSAFGVAITTVLIEVINDPSRAFLVALLAAAVLLLVAIPSVFIMPASSKVRASQTKPGYAGSTQSGTAPVNSRRHSSGSW